VISGLNFGTSPISFLQIWLTLKATTNVTARGLAGKAVVNMSIGGSKSTALNSAIAAATRAGVVCVVAAGNENVCLQLMYNDEADRK
jgi:subtilisin family serine protease